jgi:hypothetical protein
MAQEEKKTSLFIPDSDIERKYKEQVNILLESKNSKFEIIDMGRLPEVYTALGITDKQLKTNGKALLKALGIEGKNKHNVPKETIENLLSLTYDPEAVFKSLSLSNNPDAYISVLNARTEKQEQIIAILSPSRDGHGFTFIPSVYEKHNFERFLGRIKDEQKVLYIKNEGSQLWGQLQSLPRHNQEPTTENILTKTDIVKRFNENILIKEKTMANPDFPETEKMVSITKKIKKLSSHLGPNYQLNQKTAFNYVALYTSTFGNEGLNHLGKKVDLLVIKCLKEKPEAEGIQEISRLTNRLENLNTHHVAYRNGNVSYQAFIDNENKEIAYSEKVINIIKNHLEYEKTHLPDGVIIRKTSQQKINDFLESESYWIKQAYEHREIWLENKGIDKREGWEGNAPSLRYFLSLQNVNDNPIQGDTPSLERWNINSKENIMSDERSYDSPDDYLANLKTTVPLGSSEQEEKEGLSPKEKAFRDAVINASHQRKVVADAIKNGTLACLPGADGYADTTPAVNIMTPDKPYHGEYQLFLKAIQKQPQNGFPTAEYVTYHQIDKAREAGLDVYVRQGQKGASLIIGEKNEETGEWKDKKVNLFNIAQLNNPKAIKEWAEKKIAEQAQKDLAYNQTRYGSGYKPPESKPKEPGPEIVCSSTEPEKYLGQYLAAVSMGSKFKVSPEQAAEFSEKMVSALYVPMEPRRNEQTGEIKKPPMNKQTGEPITDCFSLEKISRTANQECKEFMRDIRIAAQKQDQPEQQQQQTQAHSSIRR